MLRRLVGLLGQFVLIREEHAFVAVQEELLQVIHACPQLTQGGDESFQLTAAQTYKANKSLGFGYVYWDLTL